jgi:two-component system CheB/CheR fusion protein
MSTGVRQGCRALNVLIVDDDADAAESLAWILKGDGHEVHVALDGPSALRSAADSWPDVAFLDLAMPGMDGYRVASLLQQQAGTRSLPLFIAVSGYGTDSDRMRSHAHGFLFHFLKPAEPAIIQALLQSYAEQRVDVTR